MEHPEHGVPAEDAAVEGGDLVVGDVAPEHLAQVVEEVRLELGELVVGHVQVLELDLGLEGERALMLVRSR